MINKSLLILFAIILFNKVHAEHCIESIRANSSTNEMSEFSKIKIDINDYINTTDYHQTVDDVLMSTKGLDVQCDVNNLYQPKLKQDDSNSINNIIIPIKAGITNNIAWVIYLSKFDDDRFTDTVEGLALSIVTFSNNGNIIDSFPLSTFISYDGFAEKTSAEIQNRFITIYLQEIDYFSYDENGDRVKKMEEPIINNYKTENYLIEKGMFKPITNNNQDNNP